MHFIQMGEWIFDSQAQQLSRAQQTIQLEPITSVLLHYLCQNDGRIITRDDLICHVWNNRVVADSTINRAISILRKDLVDDPQKPTYIKTVPKQGYLLLASIRELTEQERLLHQRKRIPGFIQSLSWKNVVFFLLLSTLSVLSAINLLKSESLKIVKQAFNITPVISKKGQQGNIVLSHNEKWLLYSHQPKNNKFSNLFIKNQHTGKINQLTDGEFNDTGGSFSFDDSVIYFARLVKGQSCKIMRIDLVGFSDHKEQEVVSCNKRLGSNIVTVLPNNQEIIFRTSQKPLGYGFYRYHLKNKTYNPVVKHPKPGTNEWYQSLSPDGNWLVMLQSYAAAIEVNLIDLTGENEPQILWASTSGSGRSISWAKDNQSIYVQDNKFNRLININIHTNKVTPIPLDTQLLSSFSNQSANGEIFAVYGLRSQLDVTAVSLKDQPQENVIIDSSANDFHAVQVRQGSVFFVSNRSGFNQLYLRGADNIAVQLTDFKENIRFNSFSVHPNGENILGMADTRLFSFSMDKKVLTWLSDKHSNADWPFYNAQGDIFYLKANKYQRNLYRYVDEQRSELILEDIGVAQWLENEQGEEDLFYQKMNGVVYRHNFASKETQQVSYGLPHPGERRMWLATSKGIYFLRSGNFTKKGIYFKQHGTKEASLYFSTEPHKFNNLNLDEFNQRFLVGKSDKDMLTKVVKIDLNSAKLALNSD